MTDIAIVTGGTRGIGRAIVAKLIAQDFTVFATYQNDEAAADRLSGEFGARVITARVDGSDRGQVERFQAQLIDYPLPSVLVNNAGITRDGLFLSQEPSSFAQVMANNFGGTLNFCEVFAPLMAKARHGNIINIGSVAAQKIKLGNTAYGCAKAAIERLSLGLSVELARFDVRVNCVSPGFVDTDMFQTFAGEQAREILKSIPARRVMTADEVAQIVCLLATRQLSTLGTVLRVGNGENVG
ncbi:MULTISPECIES: SDR family NAD(P)-dependent oxidoreductase [unclassified Pseudomonas]|uniref:SDR family NAD(P)-dependent oxidoreductase n=1 Tax=unclassified Pseudomonas TaxID=196821 RepID=UPI002AC8C8B5|nr:MULTISPECIES: SDR family NAD(P)-dependent oxidoreductase [unclassified Pseudomonas]MEB0046176.1 SDR family NAD(P)-dependent oxidoreductase [Pseudomonas sp. Dout3]MEB0097436.1 SDR family NAD(P)-dependent oxidoreductase [Pseudomonas sp. DC1.2]WPX58944.1 SDR family NAD(P)-dependent oxidoreductase [Pseudomonas sp. DC1.2]